MVAFSDPGAPETVTQRTMDPGPIEGRAEVSTGYSVKLKTLYLRFGLLAVPPRASWCSKFDSSAALRRSRCLEDDEGREEIQDCSKPLQSEHEKARNPRQVIQE